MDMLGTCWGNMKEADWTWFVGLFEGEGCACVVGKTKERKGSPKIMIAMTDKDVITRAAELIGGKVYYVSKDTLNRSKLTQGYKSYGAPLAKKDMYQAALHGNPALSLMKALHPHLGAKHRGRIQTILDTFPDGCAPRGPKPWPWHGRMLS